ncbi:MAG TPA: phenylalanine--tRNA ligase subunit beta [Steroidobacteraceae bacterium]|nr:phenylalanine--tRNA ligase subunit beta [Steroidobacteraceae bacterium]
MKITRRWLEEFTQDGAGPADLAAQLTSAGLEVESLEPAAPPFSGVVVGEVLQCAPHPDAQRLFICEVTADGTDRLQIVCGAPNVRSGLKVAVARIGAHLPGEIVIKRAKLRGLESQGMLCSARELGLGSEHDGILELPAQLAVGRDLREALDLDDTILEVNATPNRGDCMSVFGIARDHAAARRRQYLSYTATPVVARHEEVVPVELVATAACPVFAGRLIRGIRPGMQSPLWLRERLRRVGVSAVSPVVDVTNYVMIELGQPMHAYDAARLAGSITVRWAAEGECMVLLDDQEYVLDPGFLVVADAHGPVGLAGIMGGRRTAIAASTSEVFFEAAHFTPQALAGRARDLGLVTDAAQRFERGVDPQLPLQAIERATALLLDIVGGEPGPVDIRGGAGTTGERRVPLRRSRLARMLGAAVPDDEVGELLRAISRRVEDRVDGWDVVSPPHRFDIAIEADLIEEVARLRGFDSIAESPAIAAQVAGFASEAQVPHDRLLAALIDRGYHEVITYSFVDPALQRAVFADAPALVIANPISAELGEMRVSLWPGLLQACRENLRRQQSRPRMFEIGRKFVLAGAQLREVDTVAGIVGGARWPEQWGAPRESADFYDLKADLGGLFALTGDAASIHYLPGELACLRPGRCARLWREGLPIGWLGELHPRLAKVFNLSPAPWLFEIEIESGLYTSKLLYKPISKFPRVRRDLAIVVDEKVSLAELQENVSVTVADLLSDFIVFDIYRGPGIDSGRKSIALGLILQDSSRTLTDVDADAVVAAVVARLRDVFSATIRDQ